MRERERFAGVPQIGGAGLGWSPHAADLMALCYLCCYQKVKLMGEC